MPVYIRKNVSFTPPSIYNMQLEDDSDYLLDPDQMRDILPQPYRMINKILTQIVEDAWAVFEERDNALLAEAQKVRPPLLELSQQVPIHSNATAMTESVDGKFVFIGLPNGLAVMDAMTQFPLHKWEENHVEITSIKTYLLAPDYHLITTMDDMAVSRIFLCAFDHLFFIKALNEHNPEGTSKTLCQKCEASNEGDYLGVSFENTETKDSWFEAHRLPVENWVKELEGIQMAITKRKEDMEEKQREKDLGEQEEELEMNQTSNKSSVIGKPVGEEMKTEESEVNLDPHAVIENLGTKFSQPTLVFKAKSPSHQLPTANTSSSIASAMSKVDQGDVLGMGLNHVLNSAHLESRDGMFTHRHKDLLNFLPAEEEENPKSVTFHFTNTSRFVSNGVEQSFPQNKPVAVVLWWSGTRHLCHHSLMKTAKDIEFKPDVVWPCSDIITCSALSVCGSHMAVGLANGNFVLWDYQMGLPKAVLSASSKSGVKDLRFLDPTLFPSDLPEYPPYPVSSATFVLADCFDGTQVLFDTCDGSQQIPRSIAAVPENDDDVQTLLKIIPELPELMLYTKKNGSMYIKDIGTGKSLCQIHVPSPHAIQSPWNPIYALGGGGHVLYLKVEGTDVSEEGEVSNISCLLRFNLREDPILKDYWSRPRVKSDLIVYQTCEQRLDALMKERLQQQALRKPRMQKHWGQLRGELDIIQNAREVAVDTLCLSF